MMCDVDLEKLQTAIDAFVKMWGELWELMNKIADATCDALEEICFDLQEQFPTYKTQRYALAKKISKCTAMEAKKAYRILRPMYYARGSC